MMSAAEKAGINDNSETNVWPAALY
jgi:hypothetical protein